MAIGTKGARVLVNNMTMLRNLLRLGQGIGLMDEVMGAADVNDGVRAECFRSGRCHPWRCRF